MCRQLVRRTFLAKRLHSSLIPLLQSLQTHALDGFGPDWPWYPSAVSSLMLSLYNMT